MHSHRLQRHEARGHSRSCTALLAVVDESQHLLPVAARLTSDVTECCISCKRQRFGNPRQGPRDKDEERRSADLTGSKNVKIAQRTLHVATEFCTDCIRSGRSPSGASAPDTTESTEGTHDCWAPSVCPESDCLDLFCCPCSDEGKRKRFGM